MIDQNTDLNELKRRAKAGDLQALQELRHLGYFEKKKAVKEGHAVSHAQKRLWILDRMDAGSAAYNLPGALLLRGPLQSSAFRKALQTLIQRHEILRTTFDAVDGEPRQFSNDFSFDVWVPLQETDLSGEANAESRAREILLDDAARPFDLAHGPLMRTRLLKLVEHVHLFYFNLHHIICDEWSLEVLLDELSELYRAEAKG